MHLIYLSLSVGKAQFITMYMVTGDITTENSITVNNVPSHEEQLV